MNPELREIIGLDVGAVHIGVARGNTVARLAQPLTTIKTSQATRQLAKLVNQHSAAALVIGLPRNLSGDETAQTAAVRAWVASIKPQFKLPIYWQDEALTSQLAKSHPDEHAQAAAAILQDWFNSPDQMVDTTRTGR